MQAATIAVVPISTWAPVSIQRAVALIVMVIACCMVFSCLACRTFRLVEARVWKTAARSAIPLERVRRGAICNRRQPRPTRIVAT